MRVCIPCVDKWLRVHVSLLCMCMVLHLLRVFLLMGFRDRRAWINQPISPVLIDIWTTKYTLMLVSL